MISTKIKEDTDQIHMCKELFTAIKDITDLKSSSEIQDKEIKEIKSDIRDINNKMDDIRTKIGESTQKVEKYTNKIIIWLVGSLFTLTGIVIAVIKIT